MKWIKGKVLWFRERDGFGIILSGDKKEFYVDISVTPDHQNLKPEQIVFFEHNKKIKDCRCAHKIQLIEEQE